jgi:hypothetical protein
MTLRDGKMGDGTKMELFLLKAFGYVETYTAHHYLGADSIFEKQES